MRRRRKSRYDVVSPTFTPKPVRLPRNATAPLYDCTCVTVRTVIDNQDDLDVLITRLKTLVPLLPSKHAAQALTN
jgi:hypothetical protein